MINGRIFRGVVERRIGSILQLTNQDGESRYLTKTNSNDWAIGWNTKAAHALEAQAILERSA